jgi:hypothetical protein
MNQMGLSYVCSCCYSGPIEGSYDLGFIPQRGDSILRFEMICSDCGQKYRVSLQIETIDRDQ